MTNHRLADQYPTAHALTCEVCNAPYLSPSEVYCTDCRRRMCRDCATSRERLGLRGTVQAVRVHPTCAVCRQQGG